MQRFFFDILDGFQVLAEGQGVLCRDLEDARQRASAAVVEIAQHLSGRLNRGISVVVRDEAGERVFVTTPEAPRED
jgi:hypothetical protein